MGNIIIFNEKKAGIFCVVCKQEMQEGIVFVNGEKQLVKTCSCDGDVIRINSGGPRDEEFYFDNYFFVVRPDEPFLTSINKQWTGYFCSICCSERSGKIYSITRRYNDGGVKSTTECDECGCICNNH